MLASPGMPDQAQQKRSGADGSELMLRRARGEEVAALCALVNSAYRGDSSRAGWTTEAHLLDGQRTDEEGLAALCARSDAALLVSEDDGGALQGTVLLERKGPGVAHLGMLTVRPLRQAAGLGRRILAAAERFAAREWQIERMELTVIAQRGELISWYERRGYEQTAERRPFPMDDPRFGLPLVPHLEFIVMRKALTP